MDLIKVLCSGSKGNSTIIKFNNHSYIVDIGVSYKKFCELSDEYLDLDATTLFVTHTHSDHIKGVFQFCKRNCSMVYGASVLLDKNIDVNVITKKTKINDIYVEPLFLSHDCRETLGYIFYLGKYKVVIVSDTGYLSERNLELMNNPDVLLLEANHDVDMLMGGSYSWPLKNRVIGDVGHLSNIQFKSYVKTIKGDNTKYLVALHLSEENNNPVIVDKVMNELNIDNYSIAFQNGGSKVIKLNWK
ncbi:MAG: MBL fold metallo-hydrolase [Bacilli bacterium]